jgi:signal transduction histidine kinase
MTSEEREAIHQLAHALRTPIAVIQGFSELLLRDDGAATPEQRRDYIERIRSAAGEMREKLDDEVSRAG